MGPTPAPHHGQGGQGTSAPSRRQPHSQLYKQQQSRIYERSQFLKTNPPPEKVTTVKDSNKRQGSRRNPNVDEKRHHSEAPAQDSNVINEVSTSAEVTAGASAMPGAEPSADAGARDLDNSQVEDNTSGMEVVLNEGASIPDDSARHIYLRCQSSDPQALKKLNSFAVGDAIFDILGEYPWHRTMASGPILVCCSSLEQVNKLLAITNFLNISVKPEVAYSFGTVQGVVSDPSICDMTMPEILERLKSQKVVNVRPIFTGTGENRIRTVHTILSFRLPHLPRHVKFGKTRLRVIPYRMYASQCHKCLWQSSR